MLTSKVESVYTRQEIILMHNLYKGPDRRRHNRLQVNFIVIFQVNRPAYVLMLVGGREIDSLMLDLSETGMAILTSHNIPVMTSLLIKFTFINVDAILDDDRVRSMEITGQVLNCAKEGRDEYRLGISFTKIKEQDKNAISNFVKTGLNR